jgi:hypothetical protein
MRTSFSTTDRTSIDDEGTLNLTAAQLAQRLDPPGATLRRSPAAGDDSAERTRPAISAPALDIDQVDGTPHRLIADPPTESVGVTSHHENVFNGGGGGGDCDDSHGRMQGGARLAQHLGPDESN